MLVPLPLVTVDDTLDGAHWRLLPVWGTHANPDVIALSMAAIRLRLKTENLIQKVNVLVKVLGF